MMYLLIELDEGKCGKLQSRLREKRSQHLFLFLCVSLCLCVELSKEGFVYGKTNQKKKDQLELEEAFLQTVGGNYSSCSISTATEVF